VIPTGVIFCESKDAEDAVNSVVKSSSITSKSPQRLPFSFKQFIPFSQSPLQVNPGVNYFLAKKQKLTVQFERRHQRKRKRAVAPEGTRTPDPLLRRQKIQLSHTDTLA